MASPLEQFTVKPIIPIKIGEFDISFTNSSLFMVLTIFSIVVLFTLCLRKRTVIPTISQSMAESAYEFIHNLMRNNVGKEGLKYFSFIFSLFLLLLSEIYWDYFRIVLLLLLI